MRTSEGYLISDDQFERESVISINSNSSYLLKKQFMDINDDLLTQEKLDKW